MIGSKQYDKSECVLLNWSVVKQLDSPSASNFMVHHEVGTSVSRTIALVGSNLTDQHNNENNFIAVTFLPEYYI